MYILVIKPHSDVSPKPSGKLYERLLFIFVASQRRRSKERTKNGMIMEGTHDTASSRRKEREVRVVWLFQNQITILTTISQKEKQHLTSFHGPLGAPLWPTEVTNSLAHIQQEERSEQEGTVRTPTASRASEEQESFTSQTLINPFSSIILHFRGDLLELDSPAATR